MSELRLTAVDFDGRQVYDVDGVDALVAHRIEALQDGVNEALQELSDRINAIAAGTQQRHDEGPKVQTVIRDDAGRITKVVSMPATVVA